MKNFQKLVRLPGSERVTPPGIQLSTMNPADLIEVSIRLKGKKSIQDWFASRKGKSKNLTRQQFTNQYGADEADITLIERFAHVYGLTVVNFSIPRKTIVLRGPIQKMSSAFGVKLSHYRHPNGTEFRGRSGHISIPVELKGKIEGVFGLDTRPVATPKFKVLKTTTGHFASQAKGISYNPNEMATFYNYPSGTGQGQQIGLIELGGGYEADDLSTYFTGLGIHTPLIQAISIDGGANSPSTPDSADGEVMLDIEVSGSIAPGAGISVYFTPNTDQGFVDAISTAIHDATHQISIISISWGGSEDSWTQQALNAFTQDFQAAASLGVTICIAAGDSGSSDGVNDGKAHVDFPASSPYVVACGGTSLVTSGNKITSETVWHDSITSATGGGISDIFTVPDYQQNIKLPASVNPGSKLGRGVPDTAADADPNTGYNVRVDGNDMVIGGTSAVAPLMAGLIARINSLQGKNAGYINPLIYGQPGAFRDIISGNNETVTGGKGYSAGPGWDACSGLGVAVGQKLLTALQGTSNNK